MDVIIKISKTIQCGLEMGLLKDLEYILDEDLFHLLYWELYNDFDNELDWAFEGELKYD